ncbi:MAG: hypothetical protein RSH52_19990 [Janthinobacterium sp.]|uniref:hypothetical protein n=1 Tax=Janthinobacterium sp. TND4EL3 TaxID=1907311 RepID=UPI0011157385|nr:hypothetical protein [Janthinobacterium sp. TND4EL3]
MPAIFTGTAARRRERRFADGVKAGVSGEAGFVVKMSFSASLICGNHYVAYPPQWPRPPENIFHFQRNKFDLPRRNKRQHAAKTRQMKTWSARK